MIRTFIHQPDFMPWLGFFEKLKKSDVYVVLDDVQFSKRDWQNRDKIKTSQGIKWLTVPVKTKKSFYQQIGDVEIDSSLNWKSKHLKTIQHSYAQSKYFEKHFVNLSKFYSNYYKKLIDFNLGLIKYISLELRIEKKKIIKSSFLNIKSKGSQKIFDICKSLGSKYYITGEPSRDYLDCENFKKNNIFIEWYKPNYIKYSQLHGEFVSDLSSIDYLFNCVK
tara:strand:- start:1406 stop:2068 length:663 start_codon:yes stop_codon:yes gene_type:complete